ncbi:MAG: glycosyltransferase family A protein [Pseudomonadota bacterium]
MTGNDPQQWPDATETALPGAGSVSHRHAQGPNHTMPHGMEGLARPASGAETASICPDDSATTPRIGPDDSAPAACMRPDDSASATRTGPDDSPKSPGKGPDRTAAADPVSGPVSGPVSSAGQVPPRVSLLLCTAGTQRREAEIAKLLKTLCDQTFTDFEVVVVDQNDDYDMAPLLAPFENRLQINHIRSARGLSRARNAGFRVARGRILGFPDDDCWYPADLLQRIDSAFKSDPGLAGVLGKGSDEQGRDMARFDAGAGPVTRANVFERSVSCALFFTREALEKTGGFDETLGLGSGTRWTGCEDYDLPIRVLDAGMRLHYDSSLIAHHPCPSMVYDEAAARRAADQSPSFGRLLALHRMGAWMVFSKLVRPLGGAALSALRGDAGKARYHWASFRGRLDGWRATQREMREGAQS